MDGVTDYITKLPAWQQEICKEIRRLVHAADPDIAESLKWGVPYFEHQGLVCGFFCARDWVHVQFPNGALLKGFEDVFEPSETKASRAIKIQKGDKILHNKFIQLVKKAVINNKADKKVRLHIPKPNSQPFVLPDFYRAILEAEGVLPEYQARPFYQQKGYIRWIEEAKQEQTRERRIITMVEELRAGVYMPPKHEQ